LRNPARGARRNGNRDLTRGRDRRHRPQARAVSQFWLEAFMPILMVALIALAAFGVIGVFLGAAVLLEQRKLADKTHTGKA